MSVSNNSVSTIADFKALSTQIAQSAYPTGTESASYKPTNSPRACPSIQTNWTASNLLPPTPNTTLCDCMYSSLSCVPSSDVAANSTALGSLFGEVCGADQRACAGFPGNTTTGSYNPFVMCNSTQQLAYVLNQYYLNQQSSSGACNWKGQAQLLSDSPSVASACSAALSSASHAATATSSSGHKSSASALRRGLGWGVVDAAIGGYVLVTAGLGAAMILL